MLHLLLTTTSSYVTTYRTPCLFGEASPYVLLSGAVLTFEGHERAFAMSHSPRAARRCSAPLLQQLKEPTSTTNDIASTVLPSFFQGKVVPTALGNAVAPPIAEVVPSEDWQQRGADAARGLLTKFKSQGKAGLLSLVAETVVFWIAILIPASLFIFHQQTGTWAPDTSDPESWTAFTTILGSCYVFCKIPPIEAARWAWVIAWTPWMAENVLGETPETDDVDASANTEGNLADDHAGHCMRSL